MTAPWAALESVTAQKMYDRIEARLAALEAIVNNRPIFTGRQTVAQSLATGSNISITLDVEDVDSANGHSTSVNTSRYVIQKAGLYAIAGQVSFVFNATGARAAQIYVNSTAVPGSRQMLGTSSGAGSPAAGASTFVVQQLAVSDFVELLGFQNSGGALNTSVNAQDASRLSVYLIG